MTKEHIGNLLTSRICGIYLSIAFFTYPWEFTAYESVRERGVWAQLNDWRNENPNATIEIRPFSSIFPGNPQKFSRTQSFVSRVLSIIRRVELNSVRVPTHL